MRGVLFAAAVLVVAVTPFLLQPGATEPSPVEFDDTVRVGVSDADLRQAQHEGLQAPQAQVFYSQYGYVVGFVGTEPFVRSLQQRRHERVWGRPLHAYVTDFSGTSPSPTSDGFLETRDSPGWTSADEAHYVVGGPAKPAFSSREDADMYAEDHGGSVVEFDGLLEVEAPVPRVYDSAEEVVEEREAQADETVEQGESHLDRRVSVVVDPDDGSKPDTVQAAVDEAPPDTTVYVSEGVYRESIVVDEDVTLKGESGAHIDGGDEGTVVTLASDDAALSGLEISGVGSETREESGGGGEGWDRSIKQAYGGSDAAVRVNSSSNVLVHDVEIRTPSTGVLLMDSRDPVVSNVTVQGSESWGDGFMGVLTINSSAVVQNSSLVDGRDSVYTHDSDGVVVRDSYMESARFGLHTMYTSDAFVKNNTVRDMELGGMAMMTRPTGSYFVGNDVRRSVDAFITAGSRSYFAGNTLVDNEYGLRMGAKNSIYTGNVVARNDVGARASSVIPSNHVRENDFVDNDVQVVAAEGSMRIWGNGGRGNHWSDAPRGVDEYRPTDPVDSSVTSVDGAVTLRRSPAYRASSELQTLVPGAVRSGVVDENPLPEPVNYDPQVDGGSDDG